MSVEDAQQPAHPSSWSDAPIREVRDRNRTLRVVVSDTERAGIERRAGVAGMSVSAFLRATGLNHPIRSTLDYQAVRELAQVAGDLGRFGGLLKLWLAEKRGQGAKPIDVDRLLKDTRSLQDQIRQIMGRV
jgi:hypothetical protein